MGHGQVTAMRSFEIDWWPKRVVSGQGCVERLPELVSALGRKRALILCGRSIAASASFQTARERLGDLFAGAFPHVEMHAPVPSLERGAAYAKEVGADVIVSIGGGSAIDSGKGVCLMHRVGTDFLAYALKPGAGADLQAMRAMPDLHLAHIAVPTTTGSGSEVTPTCGFRDPAIGHKRIFRNERLIPDIAVLDPEATTETPAILTACSGMTAVARCIEALYSGRRNPFRSALALHGLRMLTRSLPKSIASPHDLDARGDCLVASAMSAVAANVNTSAVHAIGHVVGGAYGLQHGVPHTILLASGMRMMLPAIGDEQKTLLWSLGENPESMTADEAGQRASDLIASFVSGLPLPQKLRDAGVERDSLASVAEHASRDPILLSSGAKLSAERILAMLEQAY
jgi:alcohol dehydrogenase class IV